MFCLKHTLQFCNLMINFYVLGKKDKDKDKDKSRDKLKSAKKRKVHSVNSFNYYYLFIYF